MYRLLQPWYWIALIAAQTFAAPGDSGMEQQHYRVTRFSAENGLPENNIKAVLQTRDGYLWIGTLYGLARFDGIKFKIFDHSNTPEMTHDAINDLAEDKADGSLWIGTGDGLLRYHQHHFERWNSKVGITSGGVGVVRASRWGGVWFNGQQGKATLLRNGQVQSWMNTGAADLGAIDDLDRENILMLFGATLYSLDAGASSFSLFPFPSTNTYTFSFMLEEDGSSLFCRGDGLWQHSGGKWTHLTQAQKLGDPVPDRLFRTSKGGVWVIMDDHLRRICCLLSEPDAKPVLVPELTPDIRPGRVAEDREGNLWVAANTGLYRLQPSAVRTYSRADGLTNDDIGTLTCAKDGAIWIGTSAGVSVIRDDQVLNLPVPFREGRWGALHVNLARFAERLWSKDLHTPIVNIYNDLPLLNWLGGSLPPFAFRSMLEDRNGLLWLGTSQAVFCREGEKWTLRASEHELSHPDVRVIFQDREGDIWFGTYGGGLNRWKNGKITVFQTDRGEYNNRAWWIHEDGDGVFWVASQNGLNRFVPPRNDSEKGRFFTFTTDQGLRENVVNSIQEDDFGYLWLSGLRGIYRISRSQLNQVAAGRRDQVQCIAYGEADGMLNSECNGGDAQPSGCKDPQGRIWFPTAKGVVMVDPKNIQKNEVSPPVLVTQVVADDQIIYGDNAKPRAAGAPDSAAPPSFQFHPGKGRVLAIHYTANSFTAPERVLFKYRLEGYDEEWHWDDENRRVAFYTNLRPGNYKFSVIACNNHGFWNQTGDSFSFYIAPHFWQTGPFYGGAGLALLSVAVSIQAYRLRWQKRLLKLEEQRALANQRTRIARDLHDDLGTALTGLALELDVIRRDNPEPPAAAERLAHTSKHTRELAERMREVVWTVNPRCDNVLSLAAFLEQQTAQFLKADGLRGRFDFPDDIPVLPVDGETRHELALSVREALTNVVRHAGASEVVVSLGLEDHILVLAVSDNGRGFNPAAIPGNHHGIRNMRERIGKVGGACECISAPGAGTRVIFRIPLPAAGAFGEARP